MRGDFEGLLASARTGLGAEVRVDDQLANVRVPLPEGRAQTVQVCLDNDTLRFATRCGEAVLAKDNPSLYRALLAKNHSLTHGFFAMAPDGGIELVCTQLLATCDPEEFTTALVNLAAVGDFCERELARGVPGEHLDLY